MTTKETSLLLTKSVKDHANVQRRETLEGHIQDVVDAFTHLFRLPKNPTQLAQKWFHFFGLNPLHWQDLFFDMGNSPVICMISAKPTAGFRKPFNVGGECQVIRHEHLSALLIWHTLIRSRIRNVLKHFLTRDFTKVYHLVFPLIPPSNTPRNDLELHDRRTVSL